MKSHFALLLAATLNFAGKSQTITWLDFNKDVFVKAKEQNKPVILDLGATWCHWCHVMDDSTYNNKAVVDYLSRNYICAKANQDKRPDLHSKYKEYGWPATIIFDANTRELEKIAGYVNPRDFSKILEQSSKGKRRESAPLKINNVTKASDAKWQDSAKKYIETDFYNFLDFKRGSFSMNQKFIDYDAFEYGLLHYQQDIRLKSWLKLTIDYSKNINDQVWGGVYQYSTRRDWYYPHFEKLLSIQARYLKIYAKYYMNCKDANALMLAKNIDRYINRFLKSPSGLYYNSQDADLKEGEHAGDYFVLSDKERLAKGIPRIDSSCYLKENAQIAESFVYMWAATGEENYLKNSGNILKRLKEEYKITGLGYVHDKNFKEALALGDYIYLCRALMTFYNASGESWSIEEANNIGKDIIRNFKSDNGFLNYRSDINPLPPNPILTENIDLCRVFNRLYYFTNEEHYKTYSKQIFSYLISEEVLKEIIAESGILTAKEELDAEPGKVVVFLKSNKEVEWEKALLTLWRSGSDYFMIERVIGDNVPEKYKDMKDASGNNNCAFICSSLSCSSPFFTTAGLQHFLAGKNK